MNPDLIQKMNTLTQTKESGVLGTVITRGTKDLPCGSKFLVNSKGELLAGELPEGLLSLLHEPIQKVLRQREAERLLIGSDPSLERGDSPLELFLDPITPTHRLIILGGGHIALPLVQMGKLLHYEVTVIDDRPSFANKGRFPEADQVICQDFRSALQELTFDKSTYVIVVTRGHRYDQTCLEEALKQPQAAYLGMIGSRRKVATIVSNLRENGYSQVVLDRVYTPIGLDIGAQTPEEIAISIMAEMIMVDRYGRMDATWTIKSLSQSVN
ncbi:xanthine and CO dehydrogenases maturation factor, XdhC/CoxF family [Desulfitobacterium dichloroeliminans LMG P-21439]|uniref:Xanthine and CO dehydrogenases maturation factor, XdhC/CoxF family n=1 Tax=Desulfitobacterium dichloroeliminans (strain LMG P-21439 / DCA1) TaxID=871963 RepID=L0FCD7_DESDL|nr:XdhC family protein [Desulfitobacterium dichloroeliminans]AGA70670.1 xanthine and CO dehydrogenases maturation factor, XdhC/CoxF family [Desulfitobacterium dichloroeliminans LMG P-21439]